MGTGYTEFEFDLPEALLEKLVRVFDDTEPARLEATTILSIPEEQGVYQLLLRAEKQNNLVYIGKTDAESGLRSRLARHSRKIQHRSGLLPGDVLFKAVRIFVFTAIDLETQLIAYYGGASKVNWNGSGFGSNDPGMERDTTRYKVDHFDTLYPIDVSRELSIELPETASAATYLNALKKSLPYLLRFQRPSKGSRSAHMDLESTSVTIDAYSPRTAENIISAVIKALPVGWHATMLPSHIIVYKDDDRKFPSGRLIQQSGKL